MICLQEIEKGRLDTGLQQGGAQDFVPETVSRCMTIRLIAVVADGDSVEVGADGAINIMQREIVDGRGDTIPLRPGPGMMDSHPMVILLRRKKLRC
ncbi:MAG: hypothetical protein CVV44_03700 [Spirochaetae bacterium HGW-Spirochaetae-1]|nr:MAG: hypothetical protein CVV44_03700 [Spirochaetae bacterium HGW-Spirochaetae-1]